MLELVSEISEKVGRITSHKELESKPHLRRNNRIRSIHSSLKIEANSLSLNDVRDVINGHLVLDDQKEIQEVQNAYVAYEKIPEIDPTSISDLKRIHGILTYRTARESGIFRKGDEGVIHPLILSAIFHYEFVFIHPFADGNGNVDGGGGNLNQGTEAYNWPGSSYQGVRVTVVDATSGAIICNPVDFTNKNIASIAGRIIHFGKVSKIQYRNGASLTPQSSGYVYYAPTNAMPPVVSSNSNPASIAAIKRYFCSEGAASMVANRTGINVTSLTDGTYKLVIEPVIYLIYNHLYYAMTTTEAGLYNRMLGGDLGLSLIHI